MEVLPSHGPSQRVTKDALVQALKQYQGHDIKKALKLIKKEGSIVSTGDNSITISNGKKSVTINLNKAETSKSLESHKFSLKSPKEKELKKISKLADKILSKVPESPMDADKSVSTLSSLSITKEEFNELKSELNEIKDQIIDYQKHTLPQYEMQILNGEGPRGGRKFKKVMTSEGIPEANIAFSKLLDDVVKASVKSDINAKMVEEYKIRAQNIIGQYFT